MNDTINEYSNGDVVLIGAREANWPGIVVGRKSTSRRKADPAGAHYKVNRWVATAEDFVNVVSVIRPGDILGPIPETDERYPAIQTALRHRADRLRSGARGKRP